MKKQINQILNHIEKYLKTDMKYLAKGSFWLTFGRVGVVLTSLLTMMAFSHWAPKEIFGSYEYILSILSIVGIFALPGMSSALIRAVAQNKEGMLKEAVKTKTKWSLIGVLGSLAVSFWYLINNNFVLGYSFLIASFLFPVPRISNIAFDFWKGRKDFKTDSRYSILVKIAEACFFIPFIFLTNNLTLIILGYLLSRSLFSSLFLKKTLKEVKNNEKDKTTILFGKHLTLMQIIGLLANNLDKIIIWRFLGPIQVAVYSFAHTTVGKFKGLIGITPLILPKLSQRNIKEIKKGLIKKFFKSFLFFIPATIGLVLLIPFGFRLVFPQYIESIPYTQVLFLSFLLKPFEVIKATFTANNQTKELYLFSILGNLLRIVLFVVLVPFLEIWGIVIALLLSELLNDLFVFYLFQKTN